MNKYLMQVVKIAVNNKYTTTYERLINKAVSRVSLISTKRSQKLQAEMLLGYVEGHHILPKCLCTTSRQITDKSNYAYLTAREHFITSKVIL